jgi:hypothetical protein
MIHQAGAPSLVVDVEAEQTGGPAPEDARPPIRTFVWPVRQLEATNGVQVRSAAAYGARAPDGTTVESMRIDSQPS